MKIKVFGAEHRKGVSKKTGNPYDMTIAHVLMPSRGVSGLAAKQIILDPIGYPAERIVTGTEYNVEFDSTGYPIIFEPASK